MLLFPFVRSFLLLLINEVSTMLICYSVVDNRQAAMYDRLKQGSHNLAEYKLTGYLNITMVKHQNHSGKVGSFSDFCGQRWPGWILIRL